MTDAGPGFDRCAECGASLHDGEWHPVVTDSDRSDGVDMYSFCDDECRATWTAEDEVESMAD